MAAEMTMAATLGDAAGDYIALQRAFPLVHIRDDAHFDAAMTVLWPHRTSKNWPIAPGA